MTELIPTEKMIAPAAKRDHSKNEGEAKGAALDKGTQDPKTDIMQDVAEECASAEYEASALVEDAIRQIMAENTSDFKDFLFPTRKLDVLFKRMHRDIGDRITELGADKGDFNHLMKVYRSRYSKADDIKCITNSFHEMELQTERAKAIPSTKSIVSDVKEVAKIPKPPCAIRDRLLFDEPAGLEAGASGFLQRERSAMKRDRATKRSVRFKSASPRRRHGKMDLETVDIKEEE